MTKRRTLTLSNPMRMFRNKSATHTATMHNRSRLMRNARIHWNMDPVYEGRFAGWTAQHEI